MLGTAWFNGLNNLLLHYTFKIPNSWFSEVTPQDKQRAVVKKRVFHGRKKVGKEDGIPERIRDMTVTRKTYAKWKPLSLSTKKYTKQAIENTVL